MPDNSWVVVRKTVHKNNYQFIGRYYYFVVFGLSLYTEENVS
jgi:hypothetical protein